MCVLIFNIFIDLYLFIEILYQNHIDILFVMIYCPIFNYRNIILNGNI